MNNKKPKTEFPAGYDPLKPFYLAVSIGKLDGTMGNISGQGVEGVFAAMEDAEQTLIDLNDGYPDLDGYIFHCTPVAKVWRGKVRVTKLAGKK